MNSVEHLTRLLAQPRTVPDLSSAATGDLDAVIALLEKKASVGSQCREPVDHQREVVQRFWDTRRLETLRDARLVAFGLCLPAGSQGARVIEDKVRLDALLEAADGWLSNPRWYRRCYQGLVWSYFNHDRGREGESPTGRANWLRLRDYLHRRAPATLDAQANPDWVKTVIRHPSLFGDAPCEDFVGRLLCGDRAELEALCEQLGIGESSWFLRALVEAQVLAATRRGHDEFCTLLPTLLELLSGGRAWRDAGLALLLERYAQIPQAAVHEGLRDAVARAWGTPWKPVDALRWDGIGEAARKLAGDWMKANLIDAFFSRIRDDSGTRRATFWKRYTQSIQAIEFAVGGGEGSGNEVSLQSVLQGRAPGLIAPLRDGTPADAALVLTIGCARLVAFVDPTEPVFAYDLRKPPPFDMGQPLAIEIDAANSLRLGRRDLALFHRDGVDGWRQWEQLFEAALKERFGLRVGAARAAEKSAFVDLSDVAPAADLAGPGPEVATDGHAWHSASNGEDVHWQTAEAASVPYSRPDLEVLARVHGLRLAEEGGGSAKLRVRGDAIDHRIALILERWGFAPMGGGEWRR